MTRPGPTDPTGWLLAAAALAMPLLPYGPVYLGLGHGPWIEVGVLLLSLLWAMDRLPRRSRKAACDTGRRPLLIAALTVWIVCVLGAGTLGLAMENRLGSEVLVAHLQELPARLAGPMDQEFDVLYPLRVTLVYLLGPLVLLLVHDLCGRGELGPRRARLSLGGWLAGFSAVSLLAILQYASGVGLHPEWVRMEPGVTRAHATLDDPNALGAYLALGVATVGGTGLARLRTGRDLGRLLPLVGAVGALALLATLSRSAWVAVAVASTAAVVIPGLRRSGRRNRRRVAVVGVLALAGLVVVLWARAPEPDSDPTEHRDAGAPSVTLGDRAVLWTAALEMGGDHPLTGVGLGRYRPLLREYEPGLGYTENAHSYPLQVLAEMGGTGMLALLLAAGAVGLALARPERPDSTVDPLRFGGAVGLAAFVVTQSTGNALLLPSGQVLPGLLAGSLLALDAGEHVDNGDSRRHRWWKPVVPLAMVALGLFLVAVALRPWPPHTTDRWGYAWGLHAPERPARPWPPGRIAAAWERLGIPEREVDLRHWAFRWSRERAILELRAPRGAQAILLPVSLPETPGSEPVTVWVFAEGTRPRTVQGSGRQVVELPIPVVEADGGRLVRVRLEVDGAFRPARASGSDDARLLGVAVWPVAYEF